MSFKDRLVAALPGHTDSFTNIRGSFFYVRDMKAVNGGQATIDCQAGVDAAVEIYNPNSITVDFDSFPDNALPLPNGNEKQCECVLFPEGCDQDEWVLFIETKYVKNQINAQRKEYGYPQQMVTQIKKTVEYFRNKQIISPSKKVHAIVSFPTLYEGYDAWTFPVRYEDGTEETVDDILYNYDIHIRATNYATIKSVMRLKIGERLKVPYGQ